MLIRVNVNCSLLQLITLLKTDKAIKRKRFEVKKKRHRSSGFGRILRAREL